MRPRELEYKRVKADSVKDAIAIAENIWGNELEVIGICIECGEKTASNKVFCEKHFDLWYEDMMRKIRFKNLSK